MLLDRFIDPSAPLIFGIDETIERRWGAKIKARGIYRDAVRSSQSHFAKTSGLRWVSMMLLSPIPWANRVWALPFFTVLAPSVRYYDQSKRSHKKLNRLGTTDDASTASMAPGATNNSSGRWRIHLL
jgi:hypothetical protein